MTDVAATLGSHRRLRSHLAAEITRRRSHRRRIPGDPYSSSASASALAPPGPSPVPGPGVPGHPGLAAHRGDGWVRPHAYHGVSEEEDARRAALEERLLRYRADRQQLLESFYQAYNTTPDEGAVLAARQRLEERLRAAGIRGRQEPGPSAPSDRHQRSSASGATPAGSQPGTPAPGGAPGSAREGGAGGVSAGVLGGGLEWWRRLLGGVPSSTSTSAEPKSRLLSRSGLLSLSLSRPDPKGEGDTGGAVREERQENDASGAFHKDEGRDCSVCLDRLALGEPILWLPCAHGFHADCLQPWLALGHNSCPYCRQEF